jgi:hypothetical protein
MNKVFRKLVDQAGTSTRTLGGKKKAAIAGGL